MHNILAPMLALICWTMVMWVWLYATRIPAIKAAGLQPGALKEKKDLDVLPLEVRQIADNYNHLHEQPVLFYALMVYTHLAGFVDPLAVVLAWAYVGARVVHSLWQALVNFIPIRFALFALASLFLMVSTVRAVIATLT
ncbi:MAPEG family protein [Enhygromyxa salina]|uniref:MAPEG family protein n=1 Tax=Enhygromyxa salina TaxID=215803 RepID=A0A2S9YNR0_9BACT|nr:MAPEG family protein [Enhygromyxa salina]PRQ06714.1 MAPEG family protein [Enhygromyxa salina]